VARGLCGKHYQRARKNGSLSELPRYKLVEKAICKAKQCTRLADSYGLCGTHYKRWKVYGKTSLPSQPHIDKKLWTDTNLAWLAGLIEGEGHLGCTSRGRKRYRISLGMTDEDVVRKAHKIAGMGVVRGPLKPTGLGKKKSWMWDVSRRSHCLELLQTIRHWFGHRRLAKVVQLEKSVKNSRLI